MTTITLEAVAEMRALLIQARNEFNNGEDWVATRDTLRHRLYENAESLLALAARSLAQPSRMTAREIVDQANELARLFYERRGYEVPAGFRFDQATHPHEKEAWANAVIAFELLRETEVEEALAELEDDEAMS